ncbi:MAG TPA: cobalamin-dependent protein, partial [Pirellulaceae bacterium]|nr:cobalamin-dependent protein [Pirellulaceae bacterium]
MPHVTFIPLVGVRVREEELLALGMSLPGLAPRAAAVGQLPALGLLTLAGMLPPDWTCSYLPAERCDEGLIDRVIAERPTLVAISALTASIQEAYALGRRLRQSKLPVVLGGLHVTACPDEASQHADAVVIGEGEAVWPQVLADAAAAALRPIYRPLPASGPPEWPLPRFDLLGAGPPRYTLQPQRGCPLACDFCGASRLLGKFREKPAAAICRELAQITSRTPRPLLELADDNTFAGNRDPHELFDALSAAGAR